MRKDSLLYRFLYFVALLAATYGIALIAAWFYNTESEFLWTKSLLDHVRTMPFPIAYLIWHSIELVMFAFMAVSSLAFTLLFNAGRVHTRMKSKQMKTYMKKPRSRWAAVALAAIAIMISPIALGYFIGLVIQIETLCSAMFFVMPFLWEYALGLNNETKTQPILTEVKEA